MGTRRVGARREAAIAGDATITDLPRAPQRFIAGADAIATAEQVGATLKEQIDAFRDLPSSLAVDE